jgi:hypothetical protein
MFSFNEGVDGNELWSVSHVTKAVDEYALCHGYPQMAPKLQKIRKKKSHELKNWKFSCQTHLFSSYFLRGR